MTDAKLASVATAGEHSYTDTPYPDRSPGWNPYQARAAGTLEELAYEVVIMARRTCQAQITARRADHRNAAYEMTTARVMLLASPVQMAMAAK